MNKKDFAGVRVCSRCGLDEWHDRGQSACRKCKAAAVAGRVRPAGERLCSRCGEVSEFAAGQSSCKACRNARAAELRAVRRAATNLFE